MVDDILESVPKYITDNLNNIINFYEEIMPKIIKKKLDIKEKLNINIYIDITHFMNYCLVLEY